MAGVKVGCVLLCQVTGNTVWSHMTSDSPQVCHVINGYTVSTRDSQWNWLSLVSTFTSISILLLILFFFLLARPVQNSSRLCRFKFDLHEIWQDCSYASIDGVGFLIQCNNFKMAAMTSFHPGNCCAATRCVKTKHLPRSAPVRSWSIVHSYLLFNSASVYLQSRRSDWIKFQEFSDISAGKFPNRQS